MIDIGKHVKEDIEVLKESIACLEDILDECAELFPFDMIDILREEYFANSD